MKLIAISEERLDELVQKALDDIFRGPDESVKLEKVEHRTVNYHLCVLKEQVKRAAL